MIKLFLTKALFLACCLYLSLPTFSQVKRWVGKLQRTDSISIPFTFQQHHKNGKIYWIIENAAEKIMVKNFSYSGDSIIVQMPVFESQFRMIKKGNRYEGIWIKGGALNTTVLPFYAVPGTRFGTKQKATYNITGKWAVTFVNKKQRLSVGKFVQTGNRLSGTFLNSSGDYRYLEGVIEKDSLFLSGFDGSHAFLFTARIENNNTITGGRFYSGASSISVWSAVKDNNASVETESVAMYVKPGEEKLHFSFKDLEGKTVSINDEKFSNKVLVIQLMGSWCPNCMDETAFLNAYYHNNKQRGVEVIALAYEYSTDWERSIKSLKKIRQRYNVQYTMLNTEVAVTDSLRTEKTLPQVTQIKVFPSSIIIDKKGRIRKLDTGFNGPATGEHYTAYKKEFEEMIDRLLKEE